MGRAKFQVKNGRKEEGSRLRKLLVETCGSHKKLPIYPSPIDNIEIYEHTNGAVIIARIDNNHLLGGMIVGGRDKVECAALELDLGKYLWGAAW